DRRRHRDQPGHGGAHASDRCRPGGDAVHRPPGADQIPAAHAHGPLNRAASNRLARELLGWEPRVEFMDGLHRTIDWYFSTRERQQVGGYLAEMLTERDTKVPKSAITAGKRTERR